MTIGAVVAQLLLDHPFGCAVFVIVLATIISDGIGNIGNKCDCDHDDDKE